MYKIITILLIKIYSIICKSTSSIWRKITINQEIYVYMHVLISYLCHCMMFLSFYILRIRYTTLLHIPFVNIVFPQKNEGNNIRNWYNRFSDDYYSRFITNEAVYNVYFTESHCWDSKSYWKLLKVLTSYHAIKWMIPQFIYQ